MTTGDLDPAVATYQAGKLGHRVTARRPFETRQKINRPPGTHTGRQIGSSAGGYEILSRLSRPIEGAWRKAKSSSRKRFICLWQIGQVIELIRLSSHFKVFLRCSSRVVIVNDNPITTYQTRHNFAIAIPGILQGITPIAG
jgi:hypothetical protein